MVCRSNRRYRSSIALWELQDAKANGEAKGGDHDPQRQPPLRPRRVRSRGRSDPGYAECNCSHCSRKGYLLWFVPRESLRLTDAGERARHLHGSTSTSSATTSVPDLRLRRLSASARPLGQGHGAPSTSGASRASSPPTPDDHALLDGRSRAARDGVEARPHRWHARLDMFAVCSYIASCMI